MNTTTPLLNLTELAINTGTKEIHVIDIIRDYATQIDGKITLGIMLILTFWVTSNILLPISTAGFKSSMPIIYKFYIKPFFDIGISILETFMLGVSILITMFYFIQNGINLPYKIWVISLGILILLAGFVKFRLKKLGLADNIKKPVEENDLSTLIADRIKQLNNKKE